MNELIEALKAHTQAQAEQTKMIGHLVEAICALVDSYEPEQQEQDDDQPMSGTYLLDGTRIS